MEFEKRKDTLIVYPCGEIDHHTAGRIREETDELIMQNTPSKLIMDMRNITFSDSSGIAVVMGRYKLMQNLGGTAEIKNAPPMVEKILLLSGLSKFLKINKEK